MLSGNTDNKREQDVLRQLANKLVTSTHQLSEAARRLQLAELTYREYLSRLRKLDEQMRNLMTMLQDANGEVPKSAPAYCEPPPPEPTHRKLRYADYIEFSNYAELKKFEKMGDISDEEAASFDADALMRELLRDDEAVVPVSS